MRKSTYKLGQEKRSRKTVIILLVLALLAVLVTGVFYMSRRNSNREQNQYTASSKVAEGESKDTRVSEGPEKAPPAYEGDDVNNTEGLNGVITHSSVSGENLVIRNVINQNIESGECTLTLSRGGNTVTEKVAVLKDPSSSTCQGFDIPVSKLGSGTWDIVIDITDNNGRTGKITGEVTI